MYQYYIIEIQKNATGEYAHNVMYAYDEDQNMARLKGESVYYQTLAAAAISNVAQHSVVLISDEGFPIMNQCYKHATAD